MFRFYLPNVLLQPEDGSGAASEPSSDVSSEAATSPENQSLKEPAQDTSTDKQQPATDEVEKKPDAETEGDKESEKDNKPLTSDDFEDFSMPEGIEPDEAVLGQFKEDAAKAGWNQETAQKAVDLYYKETQRQAAEFEALKSEWGQQSKADEEFGGTHFEENMALASSVMSAFGGEGLKTALDASGLGNHPEIIRFFVRVGKATKEDGRVVAGQLQGGDRLSKMYPTMNKSK